MTKQTIEKIKSNNVKNLYLNLMFEYKNSLFLYSNGKVLFHDEEGYDLINSSIHDKRKRSFKNTNFDIVQKKGLINKKNVNQIIDFDRIYFMMKDNINSSLFAVRNSDEAIVINDILIPSEVKKRYMTREELEIYLNKNNQLIKYNNLWTNSISLPTGEEILASFKKYVMEEYVTSQCDKEAIRIISPIVNNTQSSSISRDYVIMPEDILVINGNDMSMSYLTIRYEGIDWFKLEIKNIPVTKYTLAEVKELIGEKDMTMANVKLEIRPTIKKNLEIVKKFLKSI